MNRRGFLNSLLVGAGAMALDPERLLWVPGAKRIFIPKPQAITTYVVEYGHNATSGQWEARAFTAKDPKDLGILLNVEWKDDFVYCSFPD